jgi:hypothetical protein
LNVSAPIWLKRLSFIPQQKRQNADIQLCASSFSLILKGHRQFVLQ